MFINLMIYHYSWTGRMCQVDNRFFIVIPRMGIRNINFSFFLSVFMCSWHFLVLSEHCQHKSEIILKKTPKKNVGAPEFWCPGTRTLVPPMFLTVSMSFNTRRWSSHRWRQAVNCAKNFLAKIFFMIWVFIGETLLQFLGQRVVIDWFNLKQRHEGQVPWQVARHDNCLKTDYN